MLNNTFRLNSAFSTRAEFFVKCVKMSKRKKTLRKIEKDFEGLINQMTTENHLERTQ